MPGKITELLFITALDRLLRGITTITVAPKRAQPPKVEFRDRGSTWLPYGWLANLIRCSDTRTRAYKVSSPTGPTQAEDHHIIVVIYLSGKAGYGIPIHGNNVRKCFSLAEPNPLPEKRVWVGKSSGTCRL